tara:strand:- start:609 stop:1241 length:633 start_codon:yes stop_codon:yes gene_type:complete
MDNTDDIKSRPLPPISEERFHEERLRRLEVTRNFLKDSYGPSRITWGTPLWTFAGNPYGTKETYAWIMELENNPDKKEEMKLSDVPWGIDHVTHTLKDFPKFEIVNWDFNISRKGDYQKDFTHKDCDLVAIWCITETFGTVHIQADDNYVKLRKTLAEKMNMPLILHPSSRIGDLLVWPADTIYLTSPWEYEDDGEILPRVFISFDLKFV